MKTYQGKNLDELLKTIAREKNCEVEDIIYEVKEEKKGILGIGSSVTIEAYTNSDIKEFIFNYLGNFFTEVNLGVRIEIIQNKTSFKVLLNADNNALVIGKAGQTLQAINSVLKAATNSVYKKRIDVVVDVNNYKEDRFKKVKAMAKRIANEVRKTKMDVSLDPMPSDERKEIHQFLNNFPNIKTESQDEGNRRHLVIKYVEEK